MRSIALIAMIQGNHVVPTKSIAAVDFTSRRGTEEGSADAVLHLAHGGAEADEDGPADDAVPDIELGHVIDPGDRADIPIVEPVPRVQLQAAVYDRRGGQPQGLEFGLTGRALRGVGVPASVQLHRG